MLRSQHADNLKAFTQTVDVLGTDSVITLKCIDTNAPSLWNEVRGTHVFWLGIDCLCALVPHVEHDLIHVNAIDSMTAHLYVISRSGC